MMTPLDCHFEARLWLADGGRTMQWREEDRRTIQAYFAVVADEEAAEESL